MPVIAVDQEICVPDLPEMDLPYEDGEPLESQWHWRQINLLADALDQHWHDRTDVFAGGNMFIYYSFAQVRNRDYKGPDFFIVKGVDRAQPRQSWIVWEEGGRYPDVIVELLSPSTAAQDLGPKKALYEQVFRTFEYFCVNPDGFTLQGWRLSGTRYVAIQPDTRGWLWSESLQLWLGMQAGRFQGQQDTWLRFFTTEDVLVPTADEHAIAERARAEALEAENARLRAELARLQAG